LRGHFEARETEGKDKERMEKRKGKKGTGENIPEINFWLRP